MPGNAAAVSVAAFGPAEPPGTDPRSFSLAASFPQLSLSQRGGRRGTSLQPRSSALPARAAPGKLLAGGKASDPFLTALPVAGSGRNPGAAARRPGGACSSRTVPPRRVSGGADPMDANLRFWRAEGQVRGRARAGSGGLVPT